MAIFELGSHSSQTDKRHRRHWNRVQATKKFHQGERLHGEPVNYSIPFLLQNCASYVILPKKDNVWNRSYASFGVPLRCPHESSWTLALLPASPKMGGMKDALLSLIRAIGLFALCAIASASDSIKVSISPLNSTRRLGQSLQFKASVTGTTNTRVNWLVNGRFGGNSEVGTISTTGLYKAPLGGESRSVKITAQSVALTTAIANAWVSVTAGTTSSVSVSISPTSARVLVKHSQQFSATISGTSNTAVNWLVNGTLGGNSIIGTISSSGLYTAPGSLPASSITVTARSAVQSSASASASVSVKPLSVSVSISPLNASVQVGQSQQFSATVSGASSGVVNWLVSGVLGGNSTVGTISTTGLYVAPQSVPTGPVTVTARSVSNPTSSASASVTVNQPVSHSVSLSWTASSSSVVGYNVYRSGQSTGPFVKLNSSPDPATVYTDTAVVAGQTYYYITTAVNYGGVESSPSNVAKAIIP
jgi:hypothetical protein